MPGGMNGYLLGREARRRNPRLRVLLTTGYAGDPSSRAGDNDFEVLRKPYRLHDLALKVRMALNESTGARLGWALCANEKGPGRAPL